MRGYACVGLDNPKTPVNVGSAMRACGVYGASQLFYSGRRYKAASKFCTDPQKQWRHIPLIHTESLDLVIPFGCSPVAVELVPEAKSLVDYVHPERAFYIFGAEDATLGERVLGFCRDVVYVPTNGCMNLAATVNVVLYDRMAKADRG